MSDPESKLERHLKDYGAELDAELKSKLPRRLGPQAVGSPGYIMPAPRRRTSIPMVMDEVRKQFPGESARSPLREWMMRLFRWTPAWAVAAACALLVAGVWFATRPSRQPSISLQFATLNRGSPNFNEHPLGGEFSVQLDFDKRAVTLKEKGATYLGSLIPVKVPAAMNSEFSFTANGTGPSGKPTVFTGQLKLTLVDGIRTAQSDEDISVAHITGVVVTAGTTNLLDRIFIR